MELAISAAKPRLSELIAVLLAGLLLPCAAAHAQPAKVAVPDPAALNAVLDRQVASGYLPFAYARLEDRDGGVVYEHAAVNRELLPTARIDGQTWIRIWSMSKIVTISVVMDLVEEGVLALDDPVAKYLPEFADLQVAVAADGSSLTELEGDARDTACPLQRRPVQTPMTLLHLINHQAGFYYATNGIPCLDEPLAAKNVATAKNTQDFIGRLAALPLIGQPGAKYHYGLNTTILGMAAERASGKSLKALVAERLAGPLGIEGLRYGLPPGAELLPRFSGQDGALRVARPGELDIFGQDVPGYAPESALYLGGEGMVATADGYADFLRMLLRHGTLGERRFLERSTVETLYAPHTLTESPHGHNGFNLWVSGQAMREAGEGDAGLWIGGGYEGTHFWVDPKREFVAVVLTQVFWPPAGGAGWLNAFRGELYRQFATAPPPQ